jgi:hypothetical protein
MLKSIFLFFGFVLFSLGVSFSQNDKIVTINGFAPAYVGKKIEIYRIQDYLSYTESLIASTTVDVDSTFTIQFPENKTHKVIVRANKNKAYLYIQPNGKYEVFVPEKDKYDPYRPNGNTVELSFYDLDSNDINYKILSFERWINDFLGMHFYTKQAKGLEFVKELDKFKANVESAYKTDTSTFFKTFVKFSIASLDDIQQSAERNRYEKHDFYIKFSPVSYENDAYMEYVSKFYENLAPRLSFKTNNDVYLGVLKSSPTLVMKALGGEYTLINLRIREMMMVKMLSDVYYSGDFPQSNILTILDSVSNKAMFEATKGIAKNVKDRLLELVPGGKAPDFNLKSTDGSISNLSTFTKKHLYFHFFDPSSLENQTELQLLFPLQQKYIDGVQFVTLYKKKANYTEQEKKILASIKWKTFEINEDDPILKDYKIETFPSYVLIDAYGYVVSSPALGPRPNGEGVNIERTFFGIQKVLSEKE